MVFFSSNGAHIVPGEGGDGQDAQQQLQDVETEQAGTEDDLQAQDEGLQQQVVDGQRRTGQQDEDGDAGGQAALTQVPLPTWTTQL